MKPTINDTLPRHMPALDGLRAVAILLVILTHTADGWRRALMVVRDAEWMAPLSLPAWAVKIADHGSMGVELFFVVSAFTLTASLHRNPLPLGGYALRRIARVAPGYWLAGLAYTAAAGLGPRFLAPDGTSLFDLLAAFLFISTWTGGAALAVVPGGWSVSAEATFYVVLPAALWLIGGRLPRALLLAVALTVAAQAFARAVVLRDGFHQGAFFSPVEHLPVFAYGIAAALAAMSARQPFPAWLGLLPLVVATAILPLVPISMGTLMPQLPFSALCAITVAAVAIRPPALLTGRLLRRIGEVSYSMYLVHWAVLPVSLWTAEHMCPAHDWTTLACHFVLTAAVAFGVSCVTYRVIEQPAIRWAHRVTGRKIVVSA